MAQSTMTTDLREQPPLSEEERAEARRVIHETEAEEAEVAAAPRRGRTLFAVVNGDGTLARGQGAASATKLETGAYQILFTRAVNGGAFIATIGLSADSGEENPGEIVVNLRAGTSNGVYVRTRNSSGSVEDRSFHLAVVLS
ncbi:hypothetical protein ACI782_05720 [Geodermatophilus sp. SYSU D00703]